MADCFQHSPIVASSDYDARSIEFGGGGAIEQPD
jgi:hypothetical protein